MADALDKLLRIRDVARQNEEFDRMMLAREQVFADYKPLFSLDNLNNFDVEKFKSFLYFENNQHWTGLNRQVSRLLASKEKLIHALSILLDENRPLAPRFDEALGSLKGFGKGLASAILLVAYPDKYGVWNNTSESAMKLLGIWPTFKRGMSLGQKYEEINKVIVDTANQLEVDTWTLDGLWWLVLERSEEVNSDLEESNTALSETMFRLERHLHEFMIDNWDKLPLGSEWDILTDESGDLVGYEYPTEVGRIDILARHKDKDAWLVIELKRGRTADKVVGQILRYMGWVQKHIAGETSNVQGLIIAPEFEQNMQYALLAARNADISLARYHVRFELENLPVNG
ncbi:endonuclease NucS domain-containing protein [Oceanithermus sp.]|uniref:endonuclease NucS domain-containing protein n=1 Tax=Oceanithermus sp. TaxID=2268145 RepID=UPI00257E7BE6|nr:endonuclease NucS domain-containing protein [Oceanithermus sp.]